MRVLWVSPNGGNFASDEIMGTGGWVGSLEKSIIESNINIELAIVFISEIYSTPMMIGKVTYYPVYYPKQNNLQKLNSRWFNKQEQYEDDILQKMCSCIKSFKPEVIHVWGIENYYAKIISRTKVPCVVHIQGFASSIIEHYLPEGVTLLDLKKIDGIINVNILKRGHYHSYLQFEQRVNNEQLMSKYVKYWMGRTEWDHAVSFCLNSEAKYFHCDELMRPEFYKKRWHYHYDGVLRIQSSISDTWYKGIDIVLKTAKLLKKIGVNFVWNVYGVDSKSDILDFVIKKLKIMPSDVNVAFNGRVSGEKIQKGLLSSDVYVHPSNIENSSNAIAEAMCVGIPIVAQYVGGNPSMLKDASGKLVQSNDPFSLSYAIISMIDKDNAELYSHNAGKTAYYRHNPNNVLNDLVMIYRLIINENGQGKNIQK